MGREEEVHISSTELLSSQMLWVMAQELSRISAFSVLACSKEDKSPHYWLRAYRQFSAPDRKSSFYNVTFSGYCHAPVNRSTPRTWETNLEWILLNKKKTENAIWEGRREGVLEVNIGEVTMNFDQNA